MAKQTEALRGLSDDELLQRLAEAREESFNLRFQHATGRLESTTRLGQVRREIARLHTLVREREIAAAEEMSRG